MATQEHQIYKARNPLLTPSTAPASSNSYFGRGKCANAIRRGSLNSIISILATDPSPKCPKLQIYCTCFDFVQCGRSTLSARPLPFTSTQMPGKPPGRFLVFWGSIGLLITWTLTEIPQNLNLKSFDPKGLA